LQLSSDEDIPDCPAPPPPITASSKWDPPSYSDCVHDCEPAADAGADLLGTFDLELLASPKRGAHGAHGGGYTNPGMTLNNTHHNELSASSQDASSNLLDMDICLMSSLPEAPPLPPKNRHHHGGGGGQAKESSPRGSPHKTLPLEYSPRHRPKPASPARHGHSLPLSSASFHEKSTSASWSKGNSPRRSTSSVSGASTVPLRTTRKWRPPLLGQLPDDFLRISISPTSSLNSSPVHTRSTRSSSRSPSATLSHTGSLRHVSVSFY
jgi:hypothetical protein